ncbi:hypothetical protein [Nafulsella turpanensis]|uniref:hypothetical protein n=1 Tax=Nafulsella turpanensis TaxID=1265690 RepID=UPI00034C4389|nr:hypothetical protein [Nafulsella turpanensis]
MKDSHTLSTLFIFLLLSASACYEAPEFPVEPEISFKDVTFYDTPNDPTDSLVISIAFQDGDGDLGLKGDELDPPYHSFTFEEDGSGNVLTISSNDTMPPFTRPYSCTNYILGRFDSTGAFYYYSTSDNSPYKKTFGEVGPDTLYSTPNPYYYNIYLEFLVEREEGFVPFDWTTAPPGGGCGISPHGRFPILFDPKLPDKPLSGTLTYQFINNGLLPYFRNETLKLRVYIIDRALHVSNIVESPPFTLEEVEAGE